MKNYSLLIFAGVLAFSLPVANQAKAGDDGTISVGSAQILPIGITRGYTKARGFGIMKRKADGTTSVRTKFEGLLPNLKYPSHVHTDLCANGAGTHYKVDTTITTAVEANEMWLSFTTDAQGAGGAKLSVNYIARPEAKSIVVHDPADKAKLLCIDLIPATDD